MHHKLDEKPQKRFCCARFEFLQSADKTMGLNIRGIDLSSAKIPGASSPFQFLLTEGYEELNVDVKFIQLNYCPFCGVQLESFYKSEDYVNEDSRLT